MTTLVFVVSRGSRRKVVWATRRRLGESGSGGRARCRYRIRGRFDAIARHSEKWCLKCLECLTTRCGSASSGRCQRPAVSMDPRRAPGGLGWRFGADRLVLPAVDVRARSFVGWPKGAQPGNSIVATAWAARALAATGEAHGLGRGGLHADGVQREGQKVCQTGAHGLAVRLHLGALADQGDVDVDDPAPTRRHAVGSKAEEAVRRCATPLGIGRREVVTDVAIAERAQDGIGQGMKARIRVGMTDQGLVVGDLDPAQPDGAAWTPAMGIEAHADAGRHSGGEDGKQGLGHGEILGHGQFHQARVADDHSDATAVPFDDGAVVGRCLAVRPVRPSRVETRAAESLRRLGPPKVGAIDGGGDGVRPALQRVDDGQDGQGPVGPGLDRRQQPVDHFGGQQRARRIMDQDGLYVGSCQGLQTGANRSGARVASGNGGPAREAGQRLGQPVVCTLGDDDDDLIGSGIQHGLDRPTHHDLAAERAPLLGGA